MTQNETIGIHRIQDINNTNNYNETGNYTGTEIAEFEGFFSEGIGTHLAGTTEITGLAILFLFGTALYKGDVEMDTTAAIMTPTTFFLAQQGFLPYGEGIIYGGLIAVVVIFVFGLFKYVAR